MQLPNYIIDLNVNSEIFSIEKEKLLVNPSFEALLSGRHQVQTVKDLPYLDRDPKIFKYVIEFMQDGNKIPQTDDTDLQRKIEEEFNFWGIPLISF